MFLLCHGIKAALSPLHAMLGATNGRVASGGNYQTGEGKAQLMRRKSVQKVVMPALLGGQANLDRKPARCSIGGTDPAAMRFDHPFCDRKPKSVAQSSLCGLATE